MPNLISNTGIQTQTQAELVTIFTDKMKEIYGDDINLGQDTPDGQMMMIFIQIIMDNLDLIKSVFNTFDPDAAMGAILDMRVAYNGIQRKEGTYTITPVDITTSQATALFGLDQTVEEVYTVKDNAGTKWFLLESVSLPTAGVSVLNFRAENTGPTLSLAATITIPVTIVLGVSSITNSSSYVSMGIEEESDAKLKVRRQKSVSLASQGYLGGLLAALWNITGVTGAFVHENNTGSTNGDGQPRNSIWVIVGGTPEDVDVAQAIYKKRNAGCTMFGSDKTYTITQKDGSAFVVAWDEVQLEDLYIRFTVDSIDGETAVNVNNIRTTFPDYIAPDVNQKVNVNQVASIVQRIDSNALITNIGLGLSATGPWINVAIPTLKKNQFTISSAKIIITPMDITPSEIESIAPTETRQFIAYGGYGAYTWTFDDNNSGGTIGVGGLYTAGATPAVTDIIKATDTQGNFVTASIGVA